MRAVCYFVQTDVFKSAFSTCSYVKLDLHFSEFSVCSVFRIVNL